jgi:hypothetical protein
LAVQVETLALTLEALTLARVAQFALSGPVQLAHSHPLTLAHHKEYHAGKN